MREKLAGRSLFLWFNLGSSEIVLRLSALVDGQSITGVAHSPITFFERQYRRVTPDWSVNNVGRSNVTIQDLEMLMLQAFCREAWINK